MTERTSVREVFFAPLLLCTLMAGCGVTTDRLADVSSSGLLLPYLETSLAITFVSILLTVFWWVLQLARTRADAPLEIVKERMRERAPYLLLPAVIFPLFFSSFTATKTAIPFLVGYTWDPFLTHADRLIFGDDAWRIAHHWLGNGAAATLEWFYCVVWGLGLFFVMALVPLNSSPRFTARFYTAMLGILLFGGFVLAYFFSSAGPVFAHLVNSDPSDQFADLRAGLSSTLEPYGPIGFTQKYLAAVLHSHEAVKGGGISAMPSMHLGVVAVYMFAAWRSRWFVPALVFWLIIFVGSAYFGYHYWIDGIVATFVALFAWICAKHLVPASATASALADASEAEPRPAAGLSGV